mgnify:FL=1
MAMVIKAIISISHNNLRQRKNDMEYNGDTDAVFNNAEAYIVNVKTEFMYMYSDRTHDFFKHIDTRKYQLAPKARIDEVLES